MITMTELKSKLIKGLLDLKPQPISLPCKRKLAKERNKRRKRLPKLKKSLGRLLLKKLKKRDSTWCKPPQILTLIKVLQALQMSFKNLCTNLSTQIQPKLPILLHKQYCIKSRNRVELNKSLKLLQSLFIHLLSRNMLNQKKPQPLNQLSPKMS